MSKLPKLLALRACHDLCQHIYLSSPSSGPNRYDSWPYRDAYTEMEDLGALDKRPWALRAAIAWEETNSPNKIERELP